MLWFAPQGYDLILATNRLAADILSANTGVHSVPLYHQPANYERFHRVRTNNIVAPP